VHRVAVVATPAPVIGEIGVAFVASGPDCNVDAHAHELRSWCQDRIADYKVPDIRHRFVRFASLILLCPCRILRTGRDLRFFLLADSLAPVPGPCRQRVLMAVFQEVLGRLAPRCGRRNTG
jgi:hypothetical protein